VRRLRGLRNGKRGQSTIEFALTYAAVILPVTMMLIFGSQLIWVWHSAADFTREGARYAATHCYQGGGANVLSYMRQNTPLMVDRASFSEGAAEIEVTYFSRNAESGELEEFACEGSDCSRECVPDMVRVRISDYEFSHFFSYLGLPPVRMPDFQTIMPMESAGCSPDEEACTP
jgi:hypothetical protein